MNPSRAPSRKSRTLRRSALRMCKKTRTLRPPDLSKVHLGAGGEKNKFFDLKVFLGNRFFRPGNSPIFRLVTAPARNFEHSGAQLQAAPRWKQAGKRRTLRPPVPEFRTPMSIGGLVTDGPPLHAPLATYPVGGFAQAFLCSHLPDEFSLGSLHCGPKTLT